MCSTCKFGEPCNKVKGYIHCNKFNVSLTQWSKCLKWEDKEK